MKESRKFLLLQARFAQYYCAIAIGLFCLPAQAGPTLSDPILDPPVFCPNVIAPADVTRGMDAYGRPVIPAATASEPRVEDILAPYITVPVRVPGRPRERLELHVDVTSLLQDPPTTCVAPSASRQAPATPARKP